MKVKSIDLGWITVSDLEKARKFFGDTLGLELTTSNEQLGWLELEGKEGGAKLGVARAHEKEQHRPGSNTVLTLKVDNIEQAKQNLEVKGVKFLGGVIEIPGHVKLATFVDPDNNTFQLVEDLS